MPPVGRAALGCDAHGLMRIPNRTEPVQFTFTTSGVLYTYYRR